MYSIWTPSTFYFAISQGCLQLATPMFSMDLCEILGNMCRSEIAQFSMCLILLSPIRLPYRMAVSMFQQAWYYFLSDFLWYYPIF